MSDALVTRLRTMGNLVHFLAAEQDTTATAAADCINALTSERDTLAEIVRRLGVKLHHEPDEAPYLYLDVWPNEDPIAPAQAERFRQVLDRIAKETSDE